MARKSGMAHVNTQPVGRRRVCDEVQDELSDILGKKLEDQAGTGKKRRTSIAMAQCRFRISELAYINFG